MKYRYQKEKFNAARRCLMLPHYNGEAESIVYAFNECKNGLKGLNRDSIKDDNALIWISKLEQFMDTSGLEDPADKGLWLVKAEKFTRDEKVELSKIVDELAHWFSMEHKDD